MPVVYLNFNCYFSLPGQIRDDNGEGEEAGPQAQQRCVEEHADEPPSLGREYGTALRRNSP
jgi:hypothetical protein